jgi:hypothetical protein
LLIPQLCKSDRLAVSTQMDIHRLNIPHPLGMSCVLKESLVPWSFDVLTAPRFNSVFVALYLRCGFNFCSLLVT